MQGATPVGSGGPTPAAQPPPPNTPNYPPVRPNRDQPIAMPRAYRFSWSDYTSYCDRCGQPIGQDEERVKEAKSKEARSKGDYGRTWHAICYTADGEPLGVAPWHNPTSEAARRQAGRMLGPRTGGHQ